MLGATYRIKAHVISLTLLCSERNLKSLALAVINTARRGYPADIGAHIALRS